MLNQCMARVGCELLYFSNIIYHIGFLSGMSEDAKWPQVIIMETDFVLIKGFFLCTV